MGDSQIHKITYNCNCGTFRVETDLSDRMFDEQAYSKTSYAPEVPQKEGALCALAGTANKLVSKSFFTNRSEEG